MPRLIDTDKRRQEIAEATWRLIRGGGLDAVSVRNVAREAGLSAGSVRHVFPTQAELVAFGMTALAERVGQRLAALAPARDAARRRGGACSGSCFPLDPERHAEAEVWFAYVSRARVDPTLLPLAEQAGEALRGVVREALGLLGREATEAVVEEVYAVLDGLTVHAVLSPGRPAPDLMEQVLRAHLARLAERRPEDGERREGRATA